MTPATNEFTPLDALGLVALVSFTLANIIADRILIKFSVYLFLADPALESFDRS